MTKGRAPHWGRLCGRPAKTAQRGTMTPDEEPSGRATCRRGLNRSPSRALELLVHRAHGSDKVFSTDAACVAVKNVNVRNQKSSLVLLGPPVRQVDRRRIIAGLQGDRRGSSSTENRRRSLEAMGVVFRRHHAAVANEQDNCCSRCVRNSERSARPPEGAAAIPAPLKGVSDAAPSASERDALGTNSGVAGTRPASSRSTALVSRLDARFATGLDLQTRCSGVGAGSKSRHVTHDVDEALFLADRIVLMTDGPEARVGDILTLPFDRPRDRRGVLEHADYRKLRKHVIDFLEHHAHQSARA